MPVPSRAMNSQKALCTSPVANTTTPQTPSRWPRSACEGAGRPACSAGSTRAGRARRRRRRWRPAPRPTRRGCPGCRAPAPPGPRCRIASTRRAKPTATSVVAPPARTACPSDIDSSPTPGRRSSGRTTSSRTTCSGLPAGLLLEERSREAGSRRDPSPQASSAVDLHGLARPVDELLVGGVVVGEEEVVAGVVLVRGDGAGRPGVQRDLAESFDARGSPWPG